MDVTSVADLEAMLPEVFNVVLGAHHLTDHTKTDIARYLGDDL